MGFPGYSALRRVGNRFAGGIQTISKKFTPELGKSGWVLLPQYARKVSEFLPLGAALVLGIWANDISTQEAILKWEKTHLPSSQIFQFAVGSRGVKEILDYRELGKILRSTPSSLDDAGSVWTSSDQNCFMYYLDPSHSVQAKIYCQDSSLQPTGWQPLGLGWRGLEAVIEILDKTVTKVPKSKKKAKEYRDPRELVY